MSKALLPIRFVQRFYKMIIALILLAGVGWLVFDYVQTKRELALLSNPEALQAQQEEEVAAVVARVGELMLLPEELPTLAVIDNVEQLAEEQPFFEGTQNGDQILIYETQAIVYRESEHIIVKVGPVFVGDEPPEGAATPTAPAEVAPQQQETQSDTEQPSPETEGEEPSQP